MLMAALFVITLALVGWAVISGGAEVAISWNLLWGYALLVVAVVSVICAAIKGTITHPAGLKSTLIAVVIVIAVVACIVAAVCFLTNPLTHKNVLERNDAVFTDFLLCK